MSATAIGSHQSASMISDRWLTPKFIIDALGPFDLDPCGAPGWDTAAEVFTPETHGDGLALDWDGYVWLNPPYGSQSGAWLNRLADHGNGVALVFARTETRMFFETVWGRATSVLFIEGRLTFHWPDGTKAKANGGAPSVLVGYGARADLALRLSGIAGKYIGLGVSHD